MILRTAQESGCKLLSEWARCQSKEGGGKPSQGLESHFLWMPGVTFLHCAPPTGVKTAQRGALEITDHNCLLTRVIGLK